MAVSAPTLGGSTPQRDAPKVMLGGYAAMAESAWMGSVQATEVLLLKLRRRRRESSYPG